MLSCASYHVLTFPDKFEKKVLVYLHCTTLTQFVEKEVCKLISSLGEKQIFRNLKEKIQKPNKNGSNCRSRVN